MKEQDQIIIYNTADDKVSIALYARDGQVWMNQQQLAELFETSKQNISGHIINILNDRELRADSVVKDYLTTASDEYDVSLISRSKTTTRVAQTGTLTLVSGIYKKNNIDEKYIKQEGKGSNKQLIMSAL